MSDHDGWDRPARRAFFLEGDRAKSFALAEQEHRRLSAGPPTEGLAEALVDLGEAEQLVGNSELAESHVVEALRLIERVLPPNPRLLVEALLVGAQTSRALKMTHTGLARARRAHEASQRAANAIPVALRARTALRFLEWSEEAALVEEALEVTEGSDEPETLSLRALALETKCRLFETGEASLDLYRTAIALRERAYGAEHVDVARCLSFLTSRFAALGHVEEAAAACKRAREIYQQAGGKFMGLMRNCAFTLYALYESLGRYQEALAELETAREGLPEDHPQAQEMSGRWILIKAKAEADKQGLRQTPVILDAKQVKDKLDEAGRRLREAEGSSKPGARLVTGYWARGQLSPLVSMADAVAELGLVENGAEPALDWPPDRKYRLLGSWLWQGRPLWQVQDDFLDRTYLCARGDEAGSPILELAAEGIVMPTDHLVQEAAVSTWWATHVETLYNLAAWCVDPRRADAAEICAARLRDDHPVVRSTACWVAPYFHAEGMPALLDWSASHDDDEQVRGLAKQAALVMRARS